MQRGKDPGKGRWTFPGGFLEEDEPPDEGLVREVFEETGLRVAVEGLVAVRHVETSAEQNLYCVYRLALAGPATDLREEGDSDEVARAMFADPAGITMLGDVGGATKWIIEHVGEDAPLLRFVRHGVPLLTTHRWATLVTPE